MIRKIFLITAYIAFITSTASAQELKVAFGMSKPPFVIDETQTGIEVSLAEEALKRAGFGVKKVFVVNKRLVAELRDNSVDVSVSVQKDQPDFFYSGAFTTFENYAVTKTKKHLKVDSFADLKGKSIISWQGAPADLNNATFTAMLKAGELSLREQGKQNLQVRAFLADNFDVILIDKTILRYLSKGLKKEMNLKDDETQFDYHKLFSGLTSFYVGFRDKGLMEKFDQALTEMKNDGTYNKIIESYVAE